MSQINVQNLTFCYEGSFDNIFENVSFSIDTNWKLGFIGRNGKGKTTFLNILLGKYEYGGSIATSAVFDYFPYEISEENMGRCAADFMEELKTGCESWRVICELDKLNLSAELLYRSFGTLSFGEQTKVMLAILFSGENDFLLIDEPTNHLDQEARQVVKDYLRSKKGFILVSHDRDLLDACVDHVLVLNRCTIEVQGGNFSSWWENKRRKDHFSEMENEKHLREIAQMKRAAERSSRWAQKNENTKIGFDPVREHDRSIATRSYIGAKTKKMQSRVKQFEHRMQREIEEKEGLLQDIERNRELKLSPLKYHKERLISVREYGFRYDGADEPALNDFNFELHRGERVFLHGSNGCGKSTFIKNILVHASGSQPETGVESGILDVGSGMIISYISQDTGYLRGSIWEFCEQKHLDTSRFCTLLRQLDMERVQFEKNMEDYSEGQKKKVLIAASLMTPAHLYIWDEPLNYIDVFSRMQIEDLIMKYEPTMLMVEHDVDFQKKTATKIAQIGS